MGLEQRIESRDRFRLQTRKTSHFLSKTYLYYLLKYYKISPEIKR